MEIFSARMRLQVWTAALAEATRTDRHRLQSLLDGRVPAEWPPKENAGFLFAFGDRLRAHKGRDGQLLKGRVEKP